MSHASFSPSRALLLRSPLRRGRLCLVILIGMAAALRAEPVLWHGEATSQASRAHLHTVAQVGSEVHVTGAVESIWDGIIYVFPPEPFLISVAMELECPALVVRQVQTLDHTYRLPLPGETVPRGHDLYTQGQTVGTYDPSRGNGWAQTPLLGWTWVRHYPWIYQAELGWLYVGSVQAQPTSGRPDAPIALLFWIWSQRDQQWFPRSLSPSQPQP